MKASGSVQNDESAATEDTLRRAVDTTPAFIHTARPDGYLDYFNRGWLDFLGKSLEDVCGWRRTEYLTIGLRKPFRFSTSIQIKASLPSVSGSTFFTQTTGECWLT